MKNMMFVLTVLVVLVCMTVAAQAQQYRYQKVCNNGNCRYVLLPMAEKTVTATSSQSVETTSEGTVATYDQTVTRTYARQGWTGRQIKRPMRLFNNRIALLGYRR